ncbi:hypothetical protein FISHEDRAFT_70896 [Fistulina hepatica ATCC 64428]|uniref:Uncharacterized protein n=1 Tax=Fistulina hepatica ATCC 64428 TaxID=1128425 RepID=A0A0D7AKE7_9AGAR|nr:hypothetical protein FISHEDRAFT_70896 [Fistulina hepatica ATCC 64428]
MAERLNTLASHGGTRFNPRSVSFDIRSPEELAAVNEFLLTLGRNMTSVREANAPSAFSPGHPHAGTTAHTYSPNHLSPNHTYSPSGSYSPPNSYSPTATFSRAEDLSADALFDAVALSQLGLAGLPGLDAPFPSTTAAGGDSAFFPGATTTSAPGAADTSFSAEPPYASLSRTAFSSPYEDLGLPSSATTAGMTATAALRRQQQQQTGYPFRSQQMPARSVPMHGSGVPARQNVRPHYLAHPALASQHVSFPPAHTSLSPHHPSLSPYQTPSPQHESGAAEFDFLRASRAPVPAPTIAPLEHVNKTMRVMIPLTAVPVAKDEDEDVDDDVSMASAEDEVEVVDESSNSLATLADMASRVQAMSSRGSLADVPMPREPPIRITVHRGPPARLTSVSAAASGTPPPASPSSSPPPTLYPLLDKSVQAPGPVTLPPIKEMLAFGSRSTKETRELVARNLYAYRSPSPAESQSSRELSASPSMHDANNTPPPSMHSVSSSGRRGGSDGSETLAHGIGRMALAQVGRRPSEYENRRSTGEEQQRRQKTWSAKAAMRRAHATFIRDLLVSVNTNYKRRFGTPPPLTAKIVGEAETDGATGKRTPTPAWRISPSMVTERAEPVRVKLEPVSDDDMTSDDDQRDMLDSEDEKTSSSLPANASQSRLLKEARCLADMDLPPIATLDVEMAPAS